MHFPVFTVLFHRSSIRFTLDNHKNKIIQHRVDKRQFGLPLHVIKVSDLTSNDLTAPELFKPNPLQSLIATTLDLLMHVPLELR